MTDDNRLNKSASKCTLKHFKHNVLTNSIILRNMMHKWIGKI